MNVPNMPRLKCPECPGELELRPSRYGLFYGCVNFPACRATHGAHADGRPKGIPGDPATRAARTALHAEFDRLWLGARDRRGERLRAYAWLARSLGITADECHIGRFDLDLCARAGAAVAAELKRRKDRP